MTYERFYSSHDHYWGWRCISCGEILDLIILQNRGTLGNNEDQRFTNEKSVVIGYREKDDPHLYQRGSIIFKLLRTIS